MSALPAPGAEYVVEAIGDKCQLRVGERVTFANAWTFDFLAGGTITSMDFCRADGRVVTLSHDPRRGARLRAL